MSEEIQKNKNLKIAIMFMIISTLGFSFMQIFVKLTSGAFTLMQQVFFRNFVMAVICGMYIFIKKQRGYEISFIGHTKNRKLLFFRSFFGFLGVITNFFAINNMVIADAGILQRTSPIFVVLMAVLIFKEKFTKEKFFTLIFAFIGAIFVVRPHFDSRLLPSIVAMLSAFSGSVAYICVSRIGRKEKTETIIFIFSLFSCICSFPFMFSDFNLKSFELIIYLFLIGVFSAVGQFGLTISYQYAKASDVSIFNYTGVVFVVILGKLILDETVSPYSLIGIFIIFLVSLFSYISEMKQRN